MKKLISSLLLTSMFSPMAFGTCDFSKGITPGPNNTYIYSLECHLAVGQLVQDNKTKDLQLIDLGKALTLKTEALDDSDKRVQLWQTTSVKMEDSLQSYDNLRSRNQWLFFALGVLVTSAAVYGAGSLAHH